MDFSEALRRLPDKLQKEVVLAAQQGGDMARALLDRGGMNPTAALMAGLALDPKGRQWLERGLIVFANPEDDLPSEAEEVVIGGGAHAAVWSATTRVKRGITPLVLDRGPRFGGTFAMTQNSSFFLNSRNRPGPLGAPGSRDALNVIPGAPMQPSDLSGAEYQANADLGLVIRCTHAMNPVVRYAEVDSVLQNGDQWLVRTDRGIVRAKRVVIATGLGKRRAFNGVEYDNERVLTFESQMERFDREVFPLRDLGRVAVIGAGDSGRTAVEALAGYGPYVGGSIASMDYVPQIDWYGAGENMTKETWLTNNRTRYKPLAALFPDKDGKCRNARVRGMNRLNNIFNTYDAVQVNTSTYDTVVSCIPLESGLEKLVGEQELTLIKSNPDGERGAPLGLGTPDRNLVVVGPAAGLEYDTVDAGISQTNENKVALFRLAPRTSALAARLTPA